MLAELVPHASMTIVIGVGDSTKDSNHGGEEPIRADHTCSPIAIGPLSTHTEKAKTTPMFNQEEYESFIVF